LALRQNYYFVAGAGKFWSKQVKHNNVDGRDPGLPHSGQSCQPADHIVRKCLPAEHRIAAAEMSHGGHAPRLPTLIAFVRAFA